MERSMIMSRELKKKELRNTRLAKTYGGWTLPIIHRCFPLCRRGWINTIMKWSAVHAIQNTKRR